MSYMSHTHFVSIFSVEEPKIKKAVPEISVTFYHSTQRYISDDRRLIHITLCETFNANFITY
jgi:hypothetical protein